MLWGLSPALDLFEELPPLNNVSGVTDEVNVLIVGGVDCRHILKTLSKRHTHKSVKYNFFVMEACMETVARQLVLLSIALQNFKETGAIQKTRTFMEVYGNSLVRPTVAKYLTAIAKEFIKMITDYEYLNAKLPFVALDIKYKERDYLENLFKYWSSIDSFNICECWDKKVRRDLGIRYDAKDGAFDWDLHMRLHEIGGKQVCSQEYKHWRGTGVAFTWIDSEVSKPNRSLACGVIPHGTKLLTFGYMGDIRTGPYVAYGLECEDKAMLKSQHGTNYYRSTDVTERNLQQLFQELHTNQEYVHCKLNNLQLGATRIQLPENRIVDVGAASVLRTMPKEFSFLGLENVGINFMSLSYLKMLKHKEQYRNFFHVMVFATNYLRHLDAETVKFVSAENASLLVENAIFLLGNRKEQMDLYAKELEEKLEGCKDCFREVKYDCQKDYFAKYSLKL